MTNEQALMAHMKIKSAQFIRTTGFNINQPGAVQGLRKAIAPYTRQWLQEAFAMGINTNPQIEVTV